MMELLTDPAAWVAFATLTALELVLGIDNVVFISILVERLPPVQQGRARRIGLGLAMLMRIGLLFAISWIIGLKDELFAVFGKGFSGRDLVLIGGGLFLIYKSTREIHGQIEGGHGSASSALKASFAAVLAQIILLDAVFSLDSIITAVGMVDQVEVMIAAVIVSVGLMMLFAAPVSAFVSAHPSVKMLALSFLLMIGMVLIADGFGLHVPKAYVYSSMGFSLGVELLNLWARKRRAVKPDPVAPPASVAGKDFQ